jgi:kelch-like protein 18
MKNRLYAIGGYNGTERLNTVEVFDAVSKQWSRVAPMTCKRRCDVTIRFYLLFY